MKTDWDIDDMHVRWVSSGQDGSKVYYFGPDKHREDGPAVIHKDGYKEWWVNGQQIPVASQEEFERYVRLLAFS